MIKSHRTRFRPNLPEALEDRAVPSALGVSALATSTTTSPTTVQAKLTVVDNAINAAYSAFATAVYQDELQFPGGFPFPPPFATGGFTTPGALLTAIDQQITTLEQALTTAVQGSISANGLGLIQAQINGSTPGSLLSGVTEVLNALAEDDSVNNITPIQSVPLLRTAINGQITASYTSVTVEAYLYATGQGSTAATSKLALAQTDGQLNAAYGSVASTITQAESALYLYPTFGYPIPDFSMVTKVETGPGGVTTTTTTTTVVQPLPPADEVQAVSTAADVVKVVDSQVGALAQSLGSLVSGPSEASAAGLIQAQIVGSGSSSLLSELNSLYNAAAIGTGANLPDGAIGVGKPQVLIAAVDAAISASYTTSLVEAYLLATS